MQTSDFKKAIINKSFVFAKDIIKLVDRFPNKRSALVISDQLLRSATSVGANIMEAQAASSSKDFINFLNHALKSGNETKFWLALARDLDKSLEEDISALLNEAEELTKILGASIVTLKSKQRL